MKQTNLALEEMESNAREAAKFLKMLSNPTRLWVLCQMVQEPRCVSELEANLSISQSALSQHLAKLREQKLVKTEKQGQNMYYSIADPKVLRVLELLYTLYCNPDAQ